MEQTTDLGLGGGGGLSERFAALDIRIRPNRSNDNLEFEHQMNLVDSKSKMLQDHKESAHSSKMGEGEGVLFEQSTKEEDLDLDSDSTPKLSRNAAKKKAKRGQKVHLYTNYVRVFVDKKEGIFEYRVNFTPPIDNLEIRKRFLDQFDEVLGLTKVFDGIFLFLPFQLNDKKTILRGHHPKHPKVGVKATVSYVQQKPHREMVVFFNVLLRRLMSAIGKYEIKRNFLDKDIKFDLPHYKLQIWPGICTSVEEQEDGLMLLLDTSYRVFRTDTVYDTMCAINDFPGWEEDFRDSIVGKVVITRYNNFTYTIIDVDWNNSPSSLFDCNGKKMTYVEYYKTQYKIDIVDPHQPLLLSLLPVKNGYRKTDQMKLVSMVPELCYLMGMKAEQRRDMKVKKEVCQYTFSTPAQKLKVLSTFIEKIHEIPEALHVLQEWNVRMDKNVLEVYGREIPGPRLQFYAKGPVQETTADFTSHTNDGVYEAVPVKRWIIICSSRDIKCVKKFRECYRKVCSSSGISMANDGTIVVQRGQTPQDYRDSLEGYIDPEATQFVIVVMPYARREVYAVIKTVCCVEKPVPSQVILSKHLTNSNNLMTIVKNVAMQINCKLGGALWGLQTPMTEKIMFVGIDVYHDVKQKQPSVVALIASMNNTCTKYSSKIQIQKIHQEYTTNVGPLFADALECYYEMNESYPDQIIVFRDGGSISTTPIMITHEVEPMVSVLNDLCPGAKFNYTAVSKRVPQRFFMQDQNGHVKNPNAGTIVEDSVSYPNVFDFYVVSQDLKERVINPTHYMVIHDIGEISPALLQRLAYATTYMYFNKCESIRVPGMIQYAHKLSSLVGQYLFTHPLISLEKTLYYL